MYTIDKLKKLEDDSFLVSASNKVTGAANILLQLIGYTIDELVGVDTYIVFTKLLRLRPSKYEQLCSEEKISCFIFTKDLEAREVIITAKQYLGENEIIYFITEKPASRLETKFQFIEYFYRHNKKGVCILQAEEFVLLRANQVYLDFYEEPYNKIENTIGHSLHEVCKSWTGSESNTIWENVLKTGEPYIDTENMFNSFSRGTTYWDTEIMPIWEDGRIKYLIQFASEVTISIMNMKMVEEQNKLLTRQAYLLDIANEAILAWDIDGVIIYWNKGAERMYGYTSEEAVGQVNHRLLNTMHSLNFNDFKTKLVTHGVWDGEVEHTCKDGTKLLIETKKQVITDSDGNNIILETNRDITERKKQQERLLVAEKEKNEALNLAIEMKNDFLSLISHEFKTPITVINSAIQAMEFICREELSDKAKGFLNKIRQNSNRQLKLVNNLLDITRINSGHLKLSMNNMDIVMLTSSVVDSINIHAHNRNIKLKFTSTMKRKIICIDEEKYERVLLNLLSNAIKFSPDGKSITVKLYQKIVEGKCMVFIQVKDKGIGIPDDKKSLIFERFGQVDSSLSRQAEGTGIGLFLVKMLVELMHGEILLESRVGVGSTFTVMLPGKKVKETNTVRVFDEIKDNRLIQATAIEFSDVYL